MFPNKRPCLLKLRNKHHTDWPSCLEALETTDILLSIGPFLDIQSLLNMRLVRRACNHIILENQTWLCRKVSQEQYGWVFKYTGKAHRDKESIPPQLANFPNLRSLIRLHISSVLAMLLLWTEFKDSDGHAILVVPSSTQASSCARGFLLLWDLADIEHSASNVKIPKLPLAEFLVQFDEPSPNSVESVPQKRGRFRHRLLSYLKLAKTQVASLPSMPKAYVRSLWWDRAVHLEDASSFEGSSSITMSRSDARKVAKGCLDKKLKYVSGMDQGAWADMQAATAAILAFCNIYMSNMLKRGDGKLPDHDSLKQSVEWLVRQGPRLLLGMISQSAQHRRNARLFIQDTWLKLPLEERIWQSELYGNSWSADEARPDYDFRALLLWNGVFYRHSRQDEWTAAGYPTLWDCVIEILRKWSTFDLEESPEALPLAQRLRAFQIIQK